MNYDPRDYHSRYNPEGDYSGIDYISQTTTGREYRDEESSGRPPLSQNTRKPKKKRGKAGKYIFAVVLSCAVAASCILSVTAFLGSRKTANGIPVAMATSQAIQTSATGTGIQLTDVSDMVSQAMPSVVSITSRAYVNNSGYMDIWDYIMSQGRGRSARPDTAPSEEVDAGIGSGSIVGMNDEELLILTSYHVVEGCSSLYVTFNDNASVDGYIKNAAEDLDIAVVAVPLKDIEESTMNSIAIAKLSEEGVEVGDGIVVIGNALGYGQSVITGVVSATGRELSDTTGSMSLIQTDAAINAGNSGGCMLNAKGEIVGISEAKIADSSVEGMCYAIPIQENLELIYSLMGMSASDTAL